ncbi:hypothetical protein [Bifidobacterium sp. UTCIF-39]|nr:hypothetical protein [Bifidobacterium sp. UTCIF-39]
MHEQHQIITEYSSTGFRWWCSCGWNTDDRQQLHQHPGVKAARP